MGDAPAAIVAPSTEWLLVPLRLGGSTSRLRMRPDEARELRDWLTAHVRDEPFGGATEELPAAREA
jgi:hypothetical protein